MKKLFSPVILLLLFINFTYADELSEGYKSFINNDTEQAYLHFSNASLINDTKAEANLMLAFIASVNKDQSVAFNHFMEFYKSSPNPYPYIMALFNHPLFTGFKALKSKDIMDFLHLLSEQSNLNSTLMAYTNEAIGKYYEATLDIKKSREYLLKIGAIMDWQVAGDFENISASGFDKNYGPLEHPEPEAIFKNKINAEVKWIDLYKQVPGKWIDLTCNFYCNNTLVYAQTFCNSLSDQLVNLRIGTSGSLKVWVNDQLLFQEDEERNNGIDTYVLPVKISKGNNRILLQLGCSKIQQCNFMMRVTNNEGKLLTDLPFTKTYSTYVKTTQDIPVLKTAMAEEFFIKQINKHPDKLINYLILANSYLTNDKTDDARGILQKAQTLAPNCSFILQQLYELYIRDQDRTSTSLTQEKLKAVDPDNSFVLNILINEAFDREDYKEVRQLIEKKESLYGESKDLLYFKLRLADFEGKAEEYSTILDEMFDKYPDDYNIVSSKYQFEKRYKKDQKSALKVLKDYSKICFNADAILALSDEYIQSGSVKNGISTLQKLIKYRPFNDGYYHSLGLFYLNAGNYMAAKQYLEECLKIAPYYGPYHGDYANAFEEMKDREHAMKEYQLDITYKPDDYYAIKKLRDLQSKKAVFDYFPVKDYYALYANSPSAAEYPSDNIVSLAEERQVVLYEEGGTEIRHIILIKALTLKGIDLLKEYRISYSSNEDFSIEKAEVLKKNGNRLQAEVDGNHIVYTSLEPGDAVFLIYKKNKSVSGLMSKNFYERSLLNTWYPNLNIEYNLLVAKNLPFNFKMDHSSIQPEITDMDDFTLYTWEKTFNKGILGESYMPPMIDFCELLNVSTLPNWDYVSKWYYDISNTKTKPEAEVIEKVHELLKGKEDLSELQKARVLYNFIEENIRYSSVSFRQNGIVPQKASKVLLTRIGDCKDLAVLFTSMCKVAGIKAEIVLVIRRQNGHNWMTLPSFDFDHAMAKAFLDGKEYYIELTSSFFPFAALNETHLNAVVFDVNNDTSKITEPKLLLPDTRQPNNSSYETKIDFDGDNMISTVHSVQTGAEAVSIRSSYRDIGNEEKENKFVKSITDSYSNLKLLTLHFDSTLNDCFDTLFYDYSFIAPKVFTKINDLYILRLPLTDKLSPMKFLSVENRKYPTEVWKYSVADTLNENLLIVFPENKTIAEVPESVHYSCNQADYYLTFNVTGDALKINRKMIYKAYEVPAEDYNTYRNFIESVVNADSQQIGFK